jgi:tetratricopeptide (TPR) repeat protein
VIDLEPIFEQIHVGDPVGAAYRLTQALGPQAEGRSFYEAGSRALSRRDELGESALRFARIVFGEAVERDPGLSAAHHDLASTMRELGMAQDAIPHYARALELSPDDVDSLIGLGAAQCDAGLLDEGIKTLRRATEEHPDHGGAFANLGVALEGAGRDEEAAAAYSKAVARFDAALIDAEDDEAAAEAAARLRWAHIQHAHLLERLERWPQAVVEFRRLYEEERTIAEAEVEDDGEEDDEDEEGEEGEGPEEPSEEILDDGARVAPDAEAQGFDDEDEDEEDDEDDDDDLAAEGVGGDVDDDVPEDAGRLGLERLFTRLVQLGKIDLAYLVLDDLGGEVADTRTRATYAIYDDGDGLPQIMVESWDGGERKKLKPGR